MRATMCAEVEELIERETLGWSEAERLRVEQHLSECDACRETLTISRFVRDTLREAAGELPEASRSRAIRNALQSDGKGRLVSVRAPRRWFGAGVAAFTVAAAAAVIVFFTSRGSEVASGPVTPAAHTESPEASTPGGTRTAQRAAVPAQALAEAEPEWFETPAPEQRKLAHAQVDFAGGTRARFDAESRLLELAAGRVEVDVETTRGESFSVQTDHFRVEVLGTQFAVTPDSVSVTRGRVQVFGRDGSVLARELAAGGHYRYSAATAAEAKARAAASSRVNERSASKASETKPSETKPSDLKKSASAWLGEARAALGRGDAKSTRDLVGEAEKSASPTRAERAEAKTLRAEAALLERDQVGALRLYREVAQQYAELSAGDNAGFAAAQLAKRADPAHERELLESYLTRFPSGRFRDEAKQRLGRLNAAQPGR